MSLSRVDAFVRVGVTGIGPVLDSLQTLEGIFGTQDILTDILHRAAVPIRNEYRAAAKTHDATGNLAKSTRIKTKRYPSGTAIAVTGPAQTGSQGATGSTPSGKHAWLVEFGSKGRRSPSQRGTRKTYVNVHTMINRRMTAHSRLEDSEKFRSRGAGYYFLMSSWREPTRQARAGRGYSHDFLPEKNGKSRVFTLKAGETYGEMPAYHLMENAIRARAGQSQNIVRSGIIDAINNSLARRLAT